MADFTEHQRRVIEHDAGHAIVSAVAGSGKTETMVARLGRLCRSVDPKRIAVVMFNRDAREDFQRRFRARIGAEPPSIRTFNAMGERLTRYLHEQGYLPAQRLETSQGLRTAIAAAALNTALGAKADRTLLEQFLEFIALVKTDVTDARARLETGSYAGAASSFALAYGHYERERTRRAVRFYEDQVHAPVMAMLSDERIQARVRDRLEHVIVDEAQDTSPVQMQMLRILAGTRASVMIVGDEDQSIYGWRGAHPQFMQQAFAQAFPHPTHYTLPHTFRFGHALAIAANHLITRNTDRYPKQVLAMARAPATRLELHAARGDAQGVVRAIEEARRRGRAWQDIAVLVRTYDVALPVELALRARAIPCFVYGRGALTEAPEINALVTLLQLACAPQEVTSQGVRDLLGMPTLYLPAGALEQVAAQAAAQPARLAPFLVEAATRLGLPDYRMSQVRERASLLAELVAAAPGLSAGELLARYCARTQFDFAVTKQAATSEQAQGIIANAKALGALAAEQPCTPAQFLARLGTIIGADATPPSAPHVWISSIHRAKGMEWPAVILPGLASARTSAAADVEAERRLFYVAITRAREELHLVHPHEAEPALAARLEHVEHSGEAHPRSSVSGFVWELRAALARQAALVLEGKPPACAIHAPDEVNTYLAAQGCAARYAPCAAPPPAVPSQDLPKQGPCGKLRPGARITTPAFGAGSVIQWCDDKLVQVRFDAGGVRTFLADIMPYQLLPADQ